MQYGQEMSALVEDANRDQDKIGSEQEMEERHTSEFNGDFIDKMVDRYGDEYNFGTRIPCTERNTG